MRLVGPCKLWDGAKNRKGYGIRKIGGRKGKVWLVHRLAWTEIHGPIPEGLCVCHACDTPACYNIDHLFLGTKADNNADMMRKGRHRGRFPRFEIGKRPGCKLTIEQAREILASNESQASLARRYGVNQSTISLLRRGRTWKELSCPA